MRRTKLKTHWINFNTWGHSNMTRFLIHADTQIQRVGYIISGWYINSNVFLPFSFLSSLNWEREYVIAILRKCLGRNIHYVYLASFFGGFLLRVFSLSRASWVFFLHSLAWMRHSSCPRAFHFFTRSLAWDSVHRDLRSKTDILYPYFRWRKRMQLPQII